MKRIALIEKLEDRAAAGSMLISLPGGLLSLLPDVMPNLPYSVPQPEQDVGSRSRPATTSRGPVATELPKSVLPASTSRPMRHPRNASPLLPTDQLSSNSPPRRASATDPWPFDGEDQDATRNDARLAEPLLVTPESSGGGGSSGSSTAYASAGFAGTTVASGGAEGESVPDPSTPANDSPAPQEETKHGDTEGTEATEPPTANGAASAHRSSEHPAAAPTTAPPNSLALNSTAPPAPITLRDFPPDLASAGWTATESGGIAPDAGTVAVVDGDAVLCEGSSFLVTLSYTFTVPDNPSDLAFSYADLNQDTTDTAFINDAFEVALVDEDGFSVVPTFSPSRDAFFNIAEELPAAVAAGVTHDAQTVTVSLADVPSGLEATLIFRLINNDSDLGSCVTITGVGGIYQNEPPVLDPLPELQAVEGAAVTLSAAFTDSGTQDTHTATVDWGDGTTSPATITEANGQGTVSADHVYADNGVYPVTLTVTDNSQDSATASTTATVTNVAPTLQASLGFEAVLVDSRYHVGVAISGQFTDPGFDQPAAGTQEQFTVQVDWGDGATSAADSWAVIQGSPGVLTTGTFTASHTYTAGGTYDVTVTVCDDDGGCVSESFRYGVILIDIKPAVRESGGSGYETSLPEGLIPVVMFGAATLDAAQITAPSLRFYPGAAPEWDTRLSFLDAAPQDGRTDAVGHFSTWDARIQPTDAVGWVVGQLSDGTPLLGVDLIGVTPASARIPFAVADLPDWLRFGTPWIAGGEGESANPDSVADRKMEDRKMGEPMTTADHIPVPHIPVRHKLLISPQNHPEGESSPSALAGPNPADPLDVNADGAATPQDALLLINALNVAPDEPAPSSLAAASTAPTVYLDVTGDGLLTPLDVLWVINGLNALALGVTPPAPSPAVDLTIQDINTDTLVYDGQWLTVSGTISATVENQGPGTVSTPFTVTFFEDLNRNSAFDAALDNVLGSTMLATPMPAGHTASAAAPLSGRVQFAGDVIWAMVDSGNAVSEADETNNIGRPASLLSPTQGLLDPKLEWSWTSTSIEPNSLNVMMTPSVIDLNADRVPDVVFASTSSTGGGLVEVGILRALRGDSGRELFSVTDPSLRINTASSLAVSDIDSDGRPEIIACDASGYRLIAFEHDGTFKWRSPNLEAINWGAVSVADLNGDGTPEIVIGRQVLRNDGTVLWTGGQGSGSLGPGSLSLVADIDMDGSPEVVAGRTAYRSNGSVFWIAPISDGAPAIGNFDDDPFPEIVVVTGGQVYLLEHTGAIKWGPRAIPGGGTGGPPTVADYDADGQPEIGVAGASRYAVFETDGTLKWQSITQDGSSNVTGSSVFDFNGDGKAEVVYRDELKLRVYDGSNGEIIFQTPMSSCTWYEYVLVADVDADANAEIVAVANNNCGYGTQRGVFVFGSESDSWVPTRQIWNQHTYHITNVNDDGTIPTHEENSWDVSNTYRLNAQPGLDPLRAPDLTASYLRGAFGNRETVITARIGNGGELFVTPSIDVAFYDADPASGGNLIGAVKTSKRLEPGTYEDITLTLDRALLPGQVWVVADDDGYGNGQVREPNEDNNIHAAFPITYEPSIRVAAPSDGNEYQVGTMLLVSGTAIGSLLTVGGFQAYPNRIVAVLVNGVAVDALDSAGNFFLQTTTLPGDNVFEVTAIDAFGQRATETVTVFGTESAEGTIEEQLFDVSPSFRAAYARTSFDEGTDLLYAQLAIENIGQYPADNPFLVGVTNIRDPQTGLPIPSISTRQTAGLTAAGIPYYDFSERVPNDSLNQNEITGFVDAVFHNPDRVPFTYDLVFLAKLNEPPVFTSVPVLQAYLGRTYTYDADATDPDGDPLTYSLLTAPRGMSIDAHTGAIAWTPTEQDRGSQQLLLRVEDPRGGAAEQRFTIEVTDLPPNRPPLITTLPVTDGIVGESYSCDVDATDPDFDPVSFAMLDKPAGMEIDQATGIITWTPTGEQVGFHPAFIEASDGRGGVDQQTFVVGVRPGSGNHAPTIVSEPVTSTYSANVSPGVINDKLFTVPGVPGQAVPVTFSLTSRSQGYSSEFGVYHVLDNTGRVGNLLPPDVGYAEAALGHGNSQVIFRTGQARGSTRTTTFTAGDALGFYIIQNTSTENFLATNPGNSVRSGQTAFFSFPAANPDNAFDHLRASVNTVDGLTQFAWEDTEFGGDRDFNDIVFTVDVPLVPGAEPAYRYDVKAVDSDGDSLHFSLSEKPAGMGVDASTGGISWIPRPDQTGLHSVAVRVDDGRGGADVQSFEILVRSSGTAQIRGVAFHDLDNDGIANVGTEPGLEGWATYLDENQNGRYDTGEIRATTDRYGNFAFTGLPPGEYVVAEDMKPGWTQTAPDSRTYTVTLADAQIVTGLDFGNSVVSGVNQPPEFVSDPPQVAEIDQLLRYQARTSDANNDSLTFDLPLAPAGMTVHPELGVVVWQPTIAQVGQNQVVLRVSDGRGGVDIQSFTIDVAAPNTRPVITTESLPAMILANSPLQVFLTAQDAEGDSITWSLTSTAGTANPPTFGPNSGVLDWTPDASQLGVHQLTVIATDARGAASSKTFDVAVVDVLPNDPPVLTSKPRTTTRIDLPYVYVVVAHDPNGDPLTFALRDDKPDGMTIDNGGILRWEPSGADLGTHPIAVIVSDGRGGEAVQEFDLLVVADAVNTAPRITSNPPLHALLNSTYRYAAAASDAEGDTVVWALDQAPRGMSVDALSGQVYWTPRPEQAGAANHVVLRVTDLFGASATQAFDVAVRSVNRPPMILSAAQTEAFVGEAYIYAVQARDPDGDAIEFSLLDNLHPAGMTIDAATGLIEWTPGQTDTGPHAVSVTVKDTYGGIDIQSFSIQVTDKNLNFGPTITSTPIYTVSAGHEYVYQPRATDPEGDAITFSLEGQDLPAELAMDADGTIRWTPDVAEVGLYVLTVVATDTALNRARQTYTLQVRENQPPTIRSTPPLIGTGGLPYRYDVRATDPEGDSLSYELTQGPDGMTIDDQGRLRWLPDASLTDQSFAVSLVVSDPFGGTAPQAYTLTLQPDTTAPSVQLGASTNLCDPGDSVRFQVLATDNIGLDTVALLVGGQQVALREENGLHVADVVFDTPGFVDVVATATDLAGNSTSTAPWQVRVFDPSDQAHPVVTVHALIPQVYDEATGGLTDGTPIVGDPLHQSPMLTYLTDVEVSISDDNMAEWRVEVAPTRLLDTGNFGAFDPDFVVLDSGTGVLDHQRFRIDTTLMANDAYILRVIAFDVNGNGWAEGVAFGVSGAAKLGNFTFTVTDVSVPLAGIPITISRTYDTLQANVTDDFGYGWSLAIGAADIAETTLKGSEMQPGDRVYLTNPDGKRVGFTYDPVLDHQVSLIGYFGTIYTPRFKPDPGVYETLAVKDGTYLRGGVFGGITGALDIPWNPSQYVLTTKDGTVYDYLQDEGLQNITDRNGNVVTFTDTAITHSSGVKIDLIRDARGRITQIIDTAGNSVYYQYDAVGDLVRFTNQAGESTTYGYRDEPAHFLDEIHDSQGVRIFKAEFDDSGRLTGSADALGNVVQQDFDAAAFEGTITDARGNVTVIGYDERGNILRRTDPLGNTTLYTYDNADNLLTETNPLGHVTSLAYDSKGNLLTKTDPLGHAVSFAYNSNGRVTRITDPLNQMYTYAYDGRGNRIQGTDPLGHSTKTTYDAAGRVVAEEDQLGYTTTYEYDVAGNRIAGTDPLGNRTTYTFDAYGNRTSTTRTRTDLDGVEYVIKNATRYDALGRTVEATDVLGQTTRYEYGVNGRLAAAVDELNRRTRYEYDDNGDLCKTIHWDGTFEEKTYDANGKVVTERDRFGRITTYEYDALDREITRSRPDGQVMTNEYDAAGRQLAALVNGQRWEYDHDAGHSFMIQDISHQKPRIVKSTAPDGTVATIDYDANGNVVSMSGPDETVQAITYDALNRPAYVQVDGQASTVFNLDPKGQLSGATQPRGVNYVYTYDPLGRLTQVVDPLGNETSYAYDELGNKLTQTDANGNTTRWDYDNAGRVQKRTLPLGMYESFTYGVDGNVATRTDFNGKATTFHYDTQNQLVSKEYPNGSTVIFTYTPSGQRETIVDQRGTTSYDYDQFGRVTRVDNPDDTFIAYTYDAFGNRANVTTRSGTATYDYDANGVLETVAGPDGGITQYGTDATTGWTTVSLPNGASTRVKTDSNGRTSWIEHLDAVDTVFKQFGIAYEEDGDNTRTVTEENGRTVTYTYDELHRLVEEQIVDSVHGDDTFTYTYDSVGNRLSKTNSSGITAYEYDANNRLIRDGEWTCMYDDNGNLIEKSNATDAWTYAYDAEDRLVRVERPDGMVVEYEYDADGVRVATIVNGDRSTYVVDKEVQYHRVLEELDETGAVQAFYVYGNSLINETRNGQPHYFHGDWLNTTRALTDAAGSPIAGYAFDAFGNLLWQEGGVWTPYQFTGEPVDANTGFTYLRARWLGSKVGRFFTADRYQGNTTDPFSQNAYLYANSDPTSNSDPSGNLALVSFAALLGFYKLFEQVVSAIGASVAISGSSVVAGWVAGLASQHPPATWSLVSNTWGWAIGDWGSVGSSQSNETLQPLKNPGGAATYSSAGIAFTFSPQPHIPPVWFGPTYAESNTSGLVYGADSTSSYEGPFVETNATAGPAVVADLCVWKNVYSDAKGSFWAIPFPLYSLSFAFRFYTYGHWIPQGNPSWS
jgi:RHS repeat-associated protein